MTDTDLMPFGKHSGKQMADVPADYLMWLWDNDKVSRLRWNKVFWYIKDNMEVIEKEIKEQQDEDEI